MRLRATVRVGRPGQGRRRAPDRPRDRPGDAIAPRRDRCPRPGPLTVTVPVGRTLPRDARPALAARDGGRATSRADGPSANAMAVRSFELTNRQGAGLRASTTEADALGVPSASLGSRSRQQSGRGGERPRFARRARLASPSSCPEAGAALVGVKKSSRVATSQDPAFEPPSFRRSSARPGSSRPRGSTSAPPSGGSSRPRGPPRRARNRHPCRPRIRLLAAVGDVAGGQRPSPARAGNLRDTGRFYDRQGLLRLGDLAPRSEREAARQCSAGEIRSATLSRGTLSFSQPGEGYRRAVEDPVEGVVIVGGDRVVFVVVAAGTGDRQAEDSLCSSVSMVSSIVRF